MIFISGSKRDSLISRIRPAVLRGLPKVIHKVAKRMLSAFVQRSGIARLKLLPAASYQLLEPERSSLGSLTYFRFLHATRRIEVNNIMLAEGSASYQHLIGHCACAYAPITISSNNARGSVRYRSIKAVLFPVSSSLYPGLPLVQSLQFQYSLSDLHAPPCCPQ